MFEIFPHTADLGFRVQAETVNALFAEAGRALLAVIVRNPTDVQPSISVTIQLQEPQLDYLLLDWLGELLYLFEAERLLLSGFKVEIADGKLHAAASGERLDESRHHLEHEVKAITYHGLSVQQSDSGWTAEVIVDI
jgi:SHS2 domain-containing protein